MTTTTNLGIPLVDQSQAQKEVTINQALNCMDAMISNAVADKDLNTPPTTPVAGVVYIVGTNPTGAWVGKANMLSYFDQIWRFVTPQNGMRVLVRDEGMHYQFNGALWQPINKATAQASAFSPLLGSGLKAWWSFNDYKSMTFTSGKVSQWNDKSGNNNHAAQPGTSRPVWSATGFNNTAPGATFANGNLVVTDAASIRNMFAGGGTMVCSFTVTGNSGNGMLVSKSTDLGGTSGYVLHHYGTGSYMLRLTVGATSSQGNYDIGPLQFNAPYVLELSYNTSTPAVVPVFILNGVKQTVTTVTATAGTVATDAGANLIIGNYVDGGTNNFVGQYGQLAFFNGSNSTSFMTRLRSYMGALAGIPTVPVYVACGQSNMVGNAACTSSSYVYDPANGVGILPQIWDGNSFSTLAPGTNNQGIDANSFGPEISFGATQSALLGQAAYIVKYALGATDLANNWAPTSGSQWIAMRATIDAALPVLANNGKIPLINAFLWTQGETDGQNLTNANAYQTNLTNFISNIGSVALAKYALSPDYVFAISGLPNQSLTTIPYVATVTTAQQTVGAVAGNCYIATKDLTLNSDQVHLDALGAITLGQRFASAIGAGFMRYISNFSLGATTLPIAAGGTNATAQSVGGVTYFDGCKIASDTLLTYDGSTLSVPRMTITTGNANALAVGLNGVTNPALQVDTSAASASTGVAITAAAAGSGVVISALGAANETMTVKSKGTGNMVISAASTGNVQLQVNGSNKLTLSMISYVFSSPSVSSTAATVRFSYTGAADTALTASTEAPNAYFNLGQIRQHATGALALQRDFRITGSTHSAVAASTITHAAAVSIDGPCMAGTNATITNSHALYIPTLALGTGITNAYGLNVTASTGATYNYAGRFSGVVILGGTAPAIAAGAGAGASPTVSIVGAPSGGTLTLTTGTAPTSGATLATVTYSAPAPTGSSVVLTPGNAAAAALTGATMVYASGTTTAFTLTSGTTALAASTAYVWQYQIVQY